MSFYSKICFKTKLIVFKFVSGMWPLWAKTIWRTYKWTSKWFSVCFFNELFYQAIFSLERQKISLQNRIRDSVCSATPLLPNYQSNMYLEVYSQRCQKVVFLFTTKVLFLFIHKLVKSILSCFFFFIFCIH